MFISLSTYLVVNVSLVLDSPPLAIPEIVFLAALTGLTPSMADVAVMYMAIAASKHIILVFVRLPRTCFGGRWIWDRPTICTFAWRCSRSPDAIVGPEYEDAPIARWGHRLKHRSELPAANSQAVAFRFHRTPQSVSTETTRPQWQTRNSLRLRVLASHWAVETSLSGIHIPRCSISRRKGGLGCG